MVSPILILVPAACFILAGAGTYLLIEARKVHRQAMKLFLETMRATSLASSGPIDIEPGGTAVFELRPRVMVGVPVPLPAADIDDLLPGLGRYVYDHIEPGSFLRSVLENDLCGAIDRGNAAKIPLIAQWLMSSVDRDCWGSPQKVQAWLAMRREKPKP